MGDGREQHAPRPSDGERVEQGMVAFDKGRKRLGAFVGQRTSVAEDDHRRAGRGDLLDEVLERRRRVGVMIARLAEDGVATPTDVAEGDGAIRPARGQGEFDGAVVLRPLDQAVADPHHPVAVVECEGFRRLSMQWVGREDRQEETSEQPERTAYPTRSLKSLCKVRSIAPSVPAGHLPRSRGRSRSFCHRANSPPENRGSTPKGGGGRQPLQRTGSRSLSIRKNPRPPRSIDDGQSKRPWRPSARRKPVVFLKVLRGGRSRRLGRDFIEPKTSDARIPGLVLNFLHLPPSYRRFLRACLVSQSAGEHEGFSAQRRTTFEVRSPATGRKSGR